MDLTINSRMAEYYERFIDLQEKLRKSEEERMKLEIKFNELMQKSRDEEQIYYRRLRSQYKKFLEEDRKRQERNEKIVRTLERIETRIDMLTSKTERFKSLRRQYQSYLQRVSNPSETKKVDPQRYNLSYKNKTPHNYQNDEHFEMEQKNINEEKMEILDRYLENISSQKCRELIEKKKVENAELEKLDILQQKLNNNFDSNKAQSIAEDIMNSIYNRHYNKENNDEQKYPPILIKERESEPFLVEKNQIVASKSDTSDEEYLPQLENLQQKHKVHYDMDTKLSKDLRNYQNGESCYVPNKIDSDIREKEKRMFAEDSNELVCVSNADRDGVSIKKSLSEAPVQSDDAIYLLGEDTDNRSTTESTEPKISKISRPISNETEDFVEVRNINHSSREDVQNTNVTVYIDKIEKNETIDNEKFTIENNTDIGKTELLLTTNKDYISTQNSHLKNNTENEKVNYESQLLEKETSEGTILDQQNKQLDESKQLINENDNECDNEKIDASDKAKQSLTCDVVYPIERIDDGKETQFIENVQPVENKTYEEIDQYYPNEQVPQYDENGQEVQYDENNHYNNHGQAIQFDENGQPITYDEHGNELHYDHNNQAFQYDENGQPMYFDESGQQIHYDESGQAVNYDENGQAHYDETGQGVHYDEFGQPIQYDETGRPIQYDENGQPIHYDESGQPIRFDGNGHPIQFDENGQPIQFDENAQYQYSQYNKPDESAQQYDENGQLIQQYGEYNASNQEYPDYYENEKSISDNANEVHQKEKQVSNSENEHFGEQILPTDSESQPGENKFALERGVDNQSKTNKILEMLDTDTESLPQNISKASNDSDFTVST